MGKEERIAYILAQIAGMYAELEAMKTANAITPTYSADDFRDLPYRYGITHNQVIEYLAGW